MRKIALIIICMGLCLSEVSWAIENDSGFWLNSKVSWPASSLVSLNTGAELRYYNDFRNFNQVLAHLGASVGVAKKIEILLGLTYMGTQRQNLRNELRISQGIKSKYELARKQSLTFIQKLEERFYPEFEQRFAVRSRSFAQYSYSFSDKGSIFASEEIFLAFNNTDWGSERPWDQNRFKVGVSWNLSQNLKAITAYMNQFIFRRSTQDINGNIVVLDLTAGF